MNESVQHPPENPPASPVVLTKSCAACLLALRSGNQSRRRIALAARLSVKKVISALDDLEAEGLAERIPAPGAWWRATESGAACVIIAKDKKVSPVVSPRVSENGRRLLEHLERPIQGRYVASVLGITRQGAAHVLLRLHRQRRIKFADPEDVSWWVLRSEDDTQLLTRVEERVLSVIPAEYATDASRISKGSRLPLDQVEAALHQLVDAGLVDAVGEFNGAALFRATAAGAGHLQNRADSRVAARPHLPVYSPRVRAMLSVIASAGALRVKEVKDTLGWNFQAANALIQYLKRKGLIRKANEAFEAPYVLTALGELTLAEMNGRGQMTSGYAPGAANTGLDNWAPRVKVPKIRKAKAVASAPRLPVQSQRVQAVLAFISETGAAGIGDISDTLVLPRQSTNSLLQNLKRRGLVQRTAETFGAPFTLTEQGRRVLEDVRQLRAA